MLITRFHQMIRNRVVWAIIATGVSLAFLLSFTSVSSMGGGNASSQNAAGKLFGEDVSQETFRQAVFFEMGLGQTRDLSPDDYEALNRQAWRRLAVLHTAEKLGITVSDEEIGELLSSERGFQSNGAFDVQRYREFVRTRGVDVPTFEAYLRENITMQKVVDIMDSASWTAPSELDRRLQNLTDSRRLDYVNLFEAQFTGSVSITAADVRAFYDDNQKFFTIPEQVRVAYVNFPYLSFTNDTVSEADVQAYYDGHSEEFTLESTNGYALPEPLELVRTGIVARLQSEASRFAARESATAFVMDLAPDRAGHRPAFETLAASRNLSVATTELFSAEEELTELAVDGEFNRAAFNLVANDPQFSFSDSIAGSNAVYVLSLIERMDARLPDLAEIENRVRPMAQSFAERKAFQAWAEQERARIMTGMAATQAFSSIASSLGHSVRTTGVFTVLQTLSTNSLFPNADLLVEAVVELEVGEVSDVIPAGPQALIAHMAERKPGDPTDLYAVRPQLLRTLQEYTTRMLYADWGNRLLAEAQFQDFATNAVPDESGSPDSGS